MQVLLRAVRHHFAQHLGELRGMFRFLKGSLLPVQANFRVALAVRHARHRQIHADLGAFALEVLAQALNDFLRRALRNAHDVLRRPCHFGFLLDELARRRLANRALLRRLLAFVNITAHAANPLHIDVPPQFILAFQPIFHSFCPAFPPENSIPRFEAK